jgi:DNA-binding winged helix-turn-helix (wHTH) protein/predicted ATPase
MLDTDTFSFPPFRLDVTNQLLWNGGKIVPLRPKTCAVLCCLVEHAGQTLSRTALRQAVWGTTQVSAQVLRASIWELRHALGDSIDQPRFIETVGQRGWRWIVEVVSSQHSVVSREEENQKSKGKEQKAKVELLFPTPNPQHLAPTLVGRETELAQLHGWLAKALQGKRQLVFISGEPGIGKTTLVDAFLLGIGQPATGNGAQKGAHPSQLLPDAHSPMPHPWIAWGQCIEQYGSGEAYLPTLAALEQLCRRQGQGFLRDLLRRYAPLWLAQLPALLEPHEQTELHQQLAGTTRERMLRELATWLEIVTATQPLVLVLEDLHWADASTVKLLAYLAQRREAARLLLIGTYRPVEVLTPAHPLHSTLQELSAQGLCQEIRVEGLKEAAVAAYLATHAAGSPLTREALGWLARWLYERTEGHPFFLVHLVEDLQARGLLSETTPELTRSELTLPATVRQLLTRQIERIDPAERQVLAAASVAGAEFSAAVVAAALQEEVVTVEEQCEGLAHRQAFLRRAGIEEWPDGTVAARYGFQHALGQQLWHEQVTPTRRQQWHHRIGLRKELAYNGQAHEIATELAIHFEQGRDYTKAIRYCGQAAECAGLRHAYQEGIAQLTTALTLLKQLPATPERDQHELGLQWMLHFQTVRLKGHTAPELQSLIAREYALVQHAPETPQVVQIMLVLSMTAMLQEDFPTARAVLTRTAQRAHQWSDPSLVALAAFVQGALHFSTGELPQAQAYLGRSNETCRSVAPEGQQVNWEIALGSFSFAALTLWQAGYAEQALQRASEGLQRVREAHLPYTEGYALIFRARVQQLRGELEQVREDVTTALRIADEQGFEELQALGRVLLGWAQVRRGAEAEGFAHLHQGLMTLRTTTGPTHQTYHLALLAEAYAATAERTKGLAAIEEALAQVTRGGEQHWAAELYRLKGELTLQREFKVQGSMFQVARPRSLMLDACREAEECFQKAIEIARRQSAKSLELRAVMSLARLWRQQGKHRAAYAMLSDVYNWFTEGFDTKDLQEAKALLEGVSRTLD